MLRDLFYQEDNLQEEAICRIYESYDEEVSTHARTHTHTHTLTHTHTP